METKLTQQAVQHLRSQTRGTSQTVHFNNAGSSLPPDVVVETVVNYLQQEAIYGGYETEDKYRDELDNTYSLIARLINAEKEEIAVVENASTAWGIAFNGINFNPGDEIITCEMEYVTNLLGFLHAQQALGVKLKVIPNDEDGNFLIDRLEKAISPQTRLIAVTHIPSTAGGMMPIVGIGKIARKHQLLYLVDACQSAGQLPLDVKAIGCDMLAVTGRKYLRAPRGTGFLFVRKSVQDELKLVFMDGFSAPSVTMDGYKTRSDARRFELYENSRALTLGLARAVEYALHIGLDKIWDRIQYLAALMRRQLASIDGLTIHDRGQLQCGIVTFSVNGFESMVIKSHLAEKQINVSVAKAISALIYMEKNHLNTIVRASVHYYNTEEEVYLLCDALKELIAR